MPERTKPTRPGKARRLTERVESRVASAVARTVARGAEAYDRRRHLPRVLPIGPAELADESAAARQAILARLARAIRAERTRGRGGHWTYDLNRHIALRQAYTAELRALRAIAGLGSDRIAPPPGAAGDDV